MVVGPLLKPFFLLSWPPLLIDVLRPPLLDGVTTGALLADGHETPWQLPAIRP